MTRKSILDNMTIAERREEVMRIARQPVVTLDDVLLFKVIIENITADTAVGNIFSDAFFVEAGRVSPIVLYVNMTGRDAIYLMETNDDFTITRAPDDWKI